MLINSAGDGSLSMEVTARTGSKSESGACAGGRWMRSTKKMIRSFRSAVILGFSSLKISNIKTIPLSKNEPKLAFITSRFVSDLPRLNTLSATIESTASDQAISSIRSTIYFLVFLYFILLFCQRRLSSEDGEDNEDGRERETFLIE